MIPVEKIAALIRIANNGARHDTRIELQLDGRSVLLDQGIAWALVTMVSERLELAARIDREHVERHGRPPLPDLRYSSDLEVKLDVIHDEDRHELVAVIAARLGGILEREGADVWGADLVAEANVREAPPRAD